MSKTIVSVERVNAVEPHPNADRLEIIQVLGFKVITQKGNFQVGNAAVYFPPDILIPPDVAEKFGVANYLKHAIFPGDIHKTQCRVGATRLRGTPSHGFCVPLENSGLNIHCGPDSPYGFDATDQFGAHKYEPPVRLGAGDAAPELPTFHTYTDIENIQRYPNAFEDDHPVVITEKIHGTNCRLGLVREDGEFVFAAGSHRVRRKEGKSLYWEFMTQDMMNLLSHLADDDDCCGTPCHDVVVFGEIFGPGIQDMDYGRTGHEFRVFDISIDGQYMNYWDMITVCDIFGLLCVPALATGGFNADEVEKHTYGATSFSEVKSKFKDREGCVVRPIVEAHSDILGGRLIVKSVSADYRDRKGAKDVE